MNPPFLQTGVYHGDKVYSCKRPGQERYYRNAESIHPLSHLLCSPVVSPSVSHSHPCKTEDLQSIHRSILKMIVCFCRWRSTPQWTWPSLTLWTMWWDVGADMTATGPTCTDVTQVKTEKPSSSPHLMVSSSPLLSLMITPFVSLHRWCLQCRDWRPVWAPETNQQQLCVAAHPRAACVGLPVGPRDYSGWTEVNGPRPSGPWDPQYQRSHNMALVPLHGRSGWNVPKSIIWNRCWMAQLVVLL